jgi:hypothetical protein
LNKGDLIDSGKEERGRKGAQIKGTRNPKLARVLGNTKEKMVIRTKGVIFTRI